MGDLLIALLALAVGIGLIIIGMPNRHGESPRLLQFYAAPMIYPGIILVFLVIGIAELIVWIATW